MARAKKGRSSYRDPGGFAAIPWTVLDSRAYQGLSLAAKALLIEIARQYHRNDNGRMIVTLAYLRTRGWTSNDTINRAKQELLDAGLIYETVKGCRPNKASWYAATWWALDKLDGYDQGAEAGFIRSAYMDGKSEKSKALLRETVQQPHKLHR
ncbi:hypothetical protein HI802_19475 (plasmid) [Ralstonia solanacearum]|nr:hypothetical protein HI802_19475 [Ralstonia solanacearum]QKL99396.1 hypothetical protein HI801_19475 [Ralstonia solanacearum]QLR11404.1 hypothetical protein H1A20_18190 [Ralstonia solanacearum]